MPCALPRGVMNQRAMTTEGTSYGTHTTIDAHEAG
jgi:hypothetical protein